MNASNREKLWDVWPVVPEGHWAFYFEGTYKFSLTFHNEEDAMALLALLNSCGAKPRKPKEVKK